MLPCQYCALSPKTIASDMIGPREKEYFSRLNTCTLFTIPKGENDFLFTSLHSGGGHDMLSQNSLEHDMEGRE